MWGSWPKPGTRWCHKVDDHTLHHCWVVQRAIIHWVALCVRTKPVLAGLPTLHVCMVLPWCDGLVRIENALR